MECSPFFQANECVFASNFACDVSGWGNAHGNVCANRCNAMMWPSNTALGVRIFWKNGKILSYEYVYAFGYLWTQWRLYKHGVREDNVVVFVGKHLHEKRYRNICVSRWRKIAESFLCILFWHWHACVAVIDFPTRKFLCDRFPLTFSI